MSTNIDKIIHDFVVNHCLIDEGVDEFYFTPIQSLKTILYKTTEHHIGYKVISKYIEDNFKCIYSKIHRIPIKKNGEITIKQRTVLMNIIPVIEKEKFDNYYKNEKIEISKKNIKITSESHSIIKNLTIDPFGNFNTFDDKIKFLIEEYKKDKQLKL